MRRAAAAFAISLAAAACQKPEEQQPRVQPVEKNSRQAEIGSPMLLRYKPVEQGGPDTFMAANVHGVLDLSGPCVRMQNMAGEFQAVVSASGSRLERDAAGLYWQVGGDRLRHGASVVGGGGEMPRLPPDQLLDGRVPDACRAGPAVELVGPQRYDPEP
jgi:hypothetical protein